MKRRTWKRTLLTVLLLLAGGAIINVAVAWAFAASWRCESNIGLTDSSSFVLGGYSSHCAFQSGFPCRSLNGTVDFADNRKSENDGFWVLSKRSSNSHLFLPLKALWPGFAINTIFYAAILWLLFAAPFALRRRIRARRGQCPACAYPIRGRTSDVCTECGGPIKTQQKRTNAQTQKAETA